MPRHENCGPEVEKFCEETGEGSSTFDLCNVCSKQWGGHDLPIEDVGERNPWTKGCRQVDTYNGDPAGTLSDTGDVCHPPYEEQSPPYECEICGEELTEEDNNK